MRNWLCNVLFDLWYRVWSHGPYDPDEVYVRILEVERHRVREEPWETIEKQVLYQCDDMLRHLREIWSDQRNG